MKTELNKFSASKKSCSDKEVVNKFSYSKVGNKGGAPETNKYSWSKKGK